jgi:uncharacterized OsmC-like protein
MKIAARVSNTVSGHTLEVETDGRKQLIAIAPKTAGRGSSVNGGELLFAAIATCFCNDLHREAAKRGIEVQDVNVEVTGTFGNPGEPHTISLTACAWMRTPIKTQLMILFAQPTP